jgi:hypothetical protein
MFTFFTVPKPFLDPHITIIQTNAFRNWKKLGIDVFVFGNDFGVREKAEEFGFFHFGDIEKNEFGTPLLNSVFRKAHIFSRKKYLVYINSDIIITSDYLKIFSYLPRENFLISGQRYDIEITHLVDFESGEWEKKLNDKTEKEGILHPPGGSDYFIFNREIFFNIPPFAVGRVAWDNWMIQEALKKNIKAIDATNLATVIHQNHNYNHQINNGVDKLQSPEGKRNYQFINSKNGLKTLDDIKYKFDKRGRILLKDNLSKKIKVLINRIRRKFKV